jgi:ApbE superfamily uncharacterized protein (UPF0280 family)
MCQLAYPLRTGAVDGAKASVDAGGEVALAFARERVVELAAEEHPILNA